VRQLAAHCQSRCDDPGKVRLVELSQKIIRNYGQRHPAGYRVVPWDAVSGCNSRFLIVVALRAQHAASDKRK